MIIPVAIPTILLLIDGLSIRLDSWKIRLCAGSREDVSAVWSAINTRGGHWLEVESMVLGPENWTA
jgi:hypothetical protein